MTDLTQQLVAVTPQEVAPAQASLVAFCRQKIQELSRDRSDLEDNLRIAADHGWATANFTRAYAKVEARIVYYQKLMTASEAGYLVVPNFPVTVLAVRVRAGRARRVTRSSVGSEVTKAWPQPTIPAGEGRYVDDRRPYEDHRYEVTRADGKKERVGVVVATDYDDVVDFPVALVKPTILEATARAMALKVFDRIGVVENQAADPMVLGQIIRPSSSSKHWPQVVSFFIAWWLDPETL